MQTWFTVSRIHLFMYDTYLKVHPNQKIVFNYLPKPSIVTLLTSRIQFEGRLTKSRIMMFWISKKMVYFPKTDQK